MTACLLVTARVNVLVNVLFVAKVVVKVHVFARDKRFEDKESSHLK